MAGAFREAALDPEGSAVQFPRALLWVGLMLATALRPNEAPRVRWTDCDAEAGLIEVVQSKDRDAEALYVPVMPALADLLARTPKTGLTNIADPRTGQPFPYETALDAFTAVRKAARLPVGEGGVPPHGLRKTMATLLAENGAVP